MPKNIVVLCDGTSNQISADRTNVLRLYGSLTRDDTQIVFYDPGVGTFGERNATDSLGSQMKILAGLAIGQGIDDNVLDAYRFIVSCYKPGDSIFMFGFSRGAYTARMTAGFMATLGLMRPEQMSLLDYTYRAYKRAKADTDDPQSDDEISHYRKVLQAPCPSITFLGLWDTVGSVREPRPSGWGGMWTSHIHVDDNARIKTVRHALAIDEWRTMFRPSLWQKDQMFTPDPKENLGELAAPQDFKEVWFAGCHTDVGGGNPEARSGLAKIPLGWMLQEASKAGVKINANATEKVVMGLGPNKYVQPDPLAAINDADLLIWRFLEYVPREHNELSSKPPLVGGYYIPRRDRRKIPEDALLHASVLERMKGDPVDGSYRPQNLPVAYDIEPNTLPIVPSHAIATTPETLGDTTKL